MWWGTPGEARPAPMADMHLVMQSSWAPELPSKRQTYFLSEGRPQAWRVDSPCLPLCLTNNASYFLFLKNLALVICELALRSGEGHSGNTLFFFLLVLRVELRVLSLLANVLLRVFAVVLFCCGSTGVKTWELALLGRHSSTWVTSPDCFFFNFHYFLGSISCFCLRPASDCDLPYLWPPA
jgi:hypothetical protein